MLGYFRVPWLEVANVEGNSNNELMRQENKVRREYAIAKYEICN